MLLARYMEQRFSRRTSSAEQEAFRRLLETEDALLYGYCLGSQPPPSGFAALIERITAAAAADRNRPPGR